MDVNECPHCKTRIPDTSPKCPTCGVVEVASVELPNQSKKDLGQVIRSNGLSLSNPRLILLSILSSQIYIFFWMYLTWKQLSKETGGVYYPIWHALSLFVPIYAWFQTYRHMKTIKSLTAEASLNPTIEPALLTVIMILISVLGATSIGITATWTVIALTVIQAILHITFITWPQTDLNRYWSKVHPDQSHEAQLTLGEIFLTLVGVAMGILGWLTLAGRIPVDSAVS